MRLPAIHPGEVLSDELAELGVPPAELARQIDVGADRIESLLRGREPMTSDMALRLGHWFGTSGEFWLNLQTAHDLRLAEAALGAEIARLPTRSAA